MFDGAAEAVEALKGIELVRVAEFRGLKGPAHYGDRFVVGLEWNREGMTVFSAVREAESCRVAEPCGGSVDDLGNKRKRLQSTRAEFLQQEKGREISQVTLVSESEHSSEALQVYVFHANVMMRRHDQSVDVSQYLVGILLGGFQDRMLCGCGVAIDEIHDLAEIFADNASVGLGNEIAHVGRVPMIATRHSSDIVHSLLHDGPLAVASEYEGMDIKLKAVGDGVVVDAGGEAAGPDKRVAVSAGHRRDAAEVVGGSAGLCATAAADIDSEFVASIGKASLQCAHHRGGYAGRVPVHAHHGAERLEPEGITEAREKFRRAVVVEDGFDNRGAEGSHSLSQPR